MTSYPRGLRNRLVAALSTMPAVVLEGGRATGKTTLTRQMVDAGLLDRLVDLSKPSDRDRAEADVDGFLRSTGTRAGIDEAQLVPDISVAVKRRIDAEAGSRFLLTGSARVGRGAMGGADPLAGRAIRLRLRPFTQGELAGEAVNTVPLLFAGSFQVGARYPVAAPEDLWRRFSLGTTAGLVVRERERAAQRQSYVESVLHLAVGESKVDRARILDVFRALAARTASRLNVTQEAGRIGLSRPTFEKYLQILEDAFLLERLQSYRPDALARLRTMPKLVVADPGLAIWAMRLERAGPDERQPVVGQLVETLVANELLAQRDWVGDSIELYHWRDQRGSEVDFVLADDRGRLVPIEVKSSRQVRPEMARGIGQFRRSNPGAVRGYVFYGGEYVVDLGSRVLGLPLSVLWSPEQKEHMTMSVTPPAPVRTGPALFVSYVHADDESQGGRIARLAKDLADRYEFNTGEPLAVFIDKDIEWGEAWRARLQSELAQATIFVPVVTPRFLASEECRREVTEFSTLADARRESRRFCPLLYATPQALDANDPVEKLIIDHQYVDWTKHRNLEPDSSQYLDQMDVLVGRLISIDEDPGVGTAVTGDATDLLSQMEQVEGDISELEIEVEHLLDVLTGGMAAFEANTPSLDSATTPSQMRAVFRRVAGALDPHVAAIGAATEAVRERTLAISSFVEQLLASDAADLMNEFLTGLPEDVGVDLGELQQTRDMLGVLRALSADLRPFVTVTEEALRLMEDLVQLPRAWRRSVEASKRRVAEREP